MSKITKTERTQIAIHITNGLMTCFGAALIEPKTEEDNKQMLNMVKSSAGEFDEALKIVLGHKEQNIIKIN